MLGIPRFQQCAVCYHVLNQWVKGYTLIEDGADFLRFGERGGRYTAAWSVKVYQWVWMIIHYHMEVELSFDTLRHFAVLAEALGGDRKRNRGHAVRGYRVRYANG